MAIHEAWRRRSVSAEGTPDETCDATLDECREMERRVIETPAATLEGVAIKIMLLAEFMDDAPNGLTETDLLLSAAEDAKRLSGHLTA